MSSSVNYYKNQKIRRTILTYFCVTLFCGLFSLIYEHFSHGVYSSFMICMFLFPLMGGVVSFGAIRLLPKLPFPGRITYNIYNSGIATLTVGSCIKGVLEIYGTTSLYMPVYWYVGIILTALGVVLYLISIKRINVNRQY